jgi:hypothetical protein
MLSDECDPEAGSLLGRIEHIESGRRSRFLSGEDLKSFVAEVLREEVPDRGSESDRSKPKQKMRQPIQSRKSNSVRRKT